MKHKETILQKLSLQGGVVFSGLLLIDMKKFINQEKLNQQVIK